MTLYEEQKKLERKLEENIERYEIIANNFMNNPQSNAFSNANYKYLLTIKIKLNEIINSLSPYTSKLSQKSKELSSKLNNLLIKNK